MLRLTPSPSSAWFASCLAVVGVVATGCRICADCEDEFYPAYGGAWQRTDRDSGRVGSVFDPAGARGSQLQPRNIPEAVEDVEPEEQTPDEDIFADPTDDTATDRQDDGDGAEGADGSDDLEGLDDLEDERTEELKDLDLDDIEVRAVPEVVRPPRLDDSPAAPVRPVRYVGG